MPATLKALKPFKVNSITYDNSSENVNHYLVNQIIGCKSYFCRPYCSAYKGAVENRNKILRQFLPKKNNFDLITEQQIAYIETVINYRPLKCLNFKAPDDLTFALQL